MIFVAMSKQDGANLIAIFEQVGNVGNNNVDSEQLRLGKHEAGIDDDDIVAPPQGHAVHAELAESA